LLGCRFLAGLLRLLNQRKSRQLRRLSFELSQVARGSSALFLYVDNEVIIAIHAGGKTWNSHAGDCTVSFRTLIFSRAAENSHRSLRFAYRPLDLRRSVQLVPKNRAVIEREVVVRPKRAGAFYVIGYEDKIGGSDRPVGKRG